MVDDKQANKVLQGIKNVVFSASDTRLRFFKLGNAARANQAKHLMHWAMMLLVDWPLVSQDNVDSLQERDSELDEEVILLEEKAEIDQIVEKEFLEEQAKVDRMGEGNS